MRKSLLEQLNEKKINYLEEFTRIYRILNHDDYSYEKLSKSFMNSRYCAYYEDLDEALFSLYENEIDDYAGQDNNVLSEINYTIQLSSNLTLNCFLNYLEFFKTLCYITNPTTSYLRQIETIVENDCAKLGYEFLYINDVFTVKLKNSTVKAVSSFLPESTTEKLEKFLTFRPSDVKSKRECIKSLADDVENICKTYSSIKEFDKLKHFIQCVRHSKDSPIKQFPFYYDNEEYWLDKIFDLIVGILAFVHSKEIVNEIISLESK